MLKRSICMILALLLILSLISAGIPTAYAASKVSDTRTIGIVFDNSGSMYMSGNQAWCRATYAMEVFASMLNTDDTLLIYPMSPITVDGKEYTMNQPFKLTNASQASLIRDIFTEDAGGTPIESIDCAAENLMSINAEKKYLIVLTDGGTFSKKDSGLSKAKTKTELDNRFAQYSSKDMTVMYLGIDADACIPATPQSEYFVSKQAKNSTDVLSVLNEMCNLIFGRDILPANHISNQTIDFDISMSKLIVFVQGENISDLKLCDASGAVVAPQGNAQQMKYSTAGAGDYNSVVDTSLQGMMVSYADCAPGTYTLDFTGKDTSISVFYEPDADLDFVFSDANGNNVDSNALYEGDYKVSFGIKDAKTGMLISSDLLGNPRYQGYYSVNGQQFPITHDGHSGEVPVSLNMGDTFDATLTVTYLSGYTITKTASDFGWTSGGIQVAARPAGDIRLEISGGDSVYSLQDLAEGTPYIAKVYYQGTQLTGSELESVELKWDPDTSNVEITQEFADDHFNLRLDYKDSVAPQDTACGECMVTIHAYYSPKGCSEAHAEAILTYNIEDDFSPLQISLFAAEDYILISELDSSQPIIVNLNMNGAKLTQRDFESVQMLVDCGGIEYTVTPDAQKSSYSIKLLSTKGIDEGDYPIHVTAVYTDHIGRVTETDDFVPVTLSRLPLWVKWGIFMLLLLALIILIIVILHIKRLPKYAKVNKKECSMIFDGEDESKSTTFLAKMEKGQMVLHSKYAGTKTGLSMDVIPGKESYLRKPQVRRTAEVKSSSVKKYGSATIQEATIGSIKYVLNEDTNKLERVPKSDKPFTLKHGTPISYTGVMMNAGVPKPFTVNTKLNFKKK